MRGVSLQEHDVFVNVVGGIEIAETAWDLPVLLALASSLADRAIARARWSPSGRSASPARCARWPMAMSG